MRRRLIQVVKRWPPLYRALRAVRTQVAARRPPMRLPGIPGRVHRNDLMLEGRDAHSLARYREHGENAVSLVEDVLRDTGRSWADVGTFLDFGCGHGCVMRYLVQKIEPSHITACDIDPEAAAFCASEFGATPIVSQERVALVPLATYDATWMGSVITHVDELSTVEILGTLATHLAPGGLLAFTSHGPKTLSSLDTFGADAVRDESRIKRAFADGGMAYVPYSHYKGDSYGLTWHAPEFIERTMDAIPQVGMKLVTYSPGAWFGFQDFWAFARTP